MTMILFIHSFVIFIVTADRNKKHLIYVALSCDCVTLYAFHWRSCVRYFDYGWHIGKSDAWWNGLGWCDGDIIHGCHEREFLKVET